MMAIPTPLEVSLMAAHVYRDASIKLEGGWNVSKKDVGLVIPKC